MDPNQQPVQAPTVVVTPLQPMPTQSSNKKPLVMIGVIILLLVLIVSGYFVFSSQKSTSQTSSSQAPAIVKTTDLSPGLPNSQKTVVIVQHSDSSQEKFVMQTSMVQDYIKTLPEGDKVVSQSPAQ